MFKHGFMSFAAICITVACLVIINSFMLITYNLNLTVNDIQEKMRVVAIVDESYTEAEAKSVGTAISDLENVKERTFISREQALEGFVADSDPAMFEGLDAQTMRDQFEITLKDNGKVAETQEELRKIPGVAEVYANVEVANSMATIRTVLYLSSLAIAIVLLVVSLLIISNTIRLAMLDRREEIAIMKMVGATNSFIRFPFFVEGFFLGLFSSVFSFFIEWGLYEVIRQAIIKTSISLFHIVPFTDVLLPMIAICAGTGFCVGIFGSLMSIRRFLKV